MAKSTLTLPPHRRRFDLCGDHKAAILLERLTWWWRRGTMQKHGVEWQAKPRAQLAQETGFTPMEVRRALEKLKDRNLIETSQHLWAGANYMHYRLLPRAMILINGTGLDEPISEAQKPSLSEAGQLGNFAQVLDHMAGIGTKISSSSSNEEDTETLVADAALGSALPQGFSGQEIPSGKAPKVSLPKSLKNPPKAPHAAKGPKLSKTSAKAGAILVAGSSAGTSLSGKPKKPAQKIGQVWQDAMKAAYPDEFHPMLTAKQQGQLKQFAQKLPPGEAEQAIRSVIADWIGFAATAMSKAGGFGLPKEPVIGVVVKFASVAANFKAKPATVPVKGNPAPKPVKAQAQLIAQKPIEDEGDTVMPTKADIAALLAGIGKKGSGASSGPKSG